MTFTIKILLALALVITAGFGLLLNNLTKRVERQYLEAAEEPMVDAANILAATVEQMLAEDTVIATDNLRAAFSRARSRRFEARIYNLTKTKIGMNCYITDDRGIVLYDSGNPDIVGHDFSRYIDVSRTLRGQYGARSTRIRKDDDSSSVMFIGAPITSGDRIIGCLSVIKQQNNLYGFIAETNRHIRNLGLLVLVAILAILAVVIIWLTLPIRSLTAYVLALRQGKKIPTPSLGRGEVAALGSAFEDLRLELENRQYVNNYIQTLTHELKSPLSAIGSAAELLDDEKMPHSRRQRFLENITTETKRLQNLINQLLRLSSIESKQSLENPALIDLSSLLRRIADNAISSHSEQGITLHQEISPNLTTSGEEPLLQLAITSVLQNAYDFAPTDSIIDLVAKKIPQEKKILIKICDRGPGIPDYAMPHIFDRFYTLRHHHTGRKSSGLGLCLAREALSLHYATISIKNTSPGTTVTITIPIAK